MRPKGADRNASPPVSGGAEVGSMGRGSGRNPAGGLCPELVFVDFHRHLLAAAADDPAPSDQLERALAVQLGRPTDRQLYPFAGGQGALSREKDASAAYVHRVAGPAFRNPPAADHLVLEVSDNGEPVVGTPL